MFVFVLKENYRKHREGTESGVPMDPVDAYMKASGGRKKGNIFGLGSAGDFWYKKDGRSGGSTTGSSTQGEIYKQNMELEALVKAQNEKLEAAQAYQMKNEEYKLAEQKEKEAMKARLLILEQMMMRGENCNQMFTKTPRDPNDPSGGGGTGARDPLEIR